MCAFQFTRGRYARALRTADMLTLFCKLRKTKNFEEIPERFLVYQTRGKNLTYAHKIRPAHIRDEKLTYGLKARPRYLT